MLICGPTGSGKTSTLYAVLNEINSIEKNVITIEDPVEYNLHGINQVQTNDKAGLTFASCLRRRSCGRILISSTVRAVSAMPRQPSHGGAFGDDRPSGALDDPH